jgi:predicted ATPase
MTRYDRGELKRIRIEGFRSIHKCDIELSPINVLIGSNGAGKSNFIAAFRLLQSVLDRELKLYVARAGLSSLFFNGPKVTEEIRLEVFFGNNSYGFDLVPTEDNNVVFRREFFGDNGALVNESNVGRGHGESLWDKGTEDPIAQYVKPILEQQNWRVYHFHDTSATARVKLEHNLSNNLMLQQDAANMASYLHRLRMNHHTHYRQIVETIRLIAPFFDDFVLQPNESNLEKIVLRWKQRGCEDVFNASQLSDGTLRFICLATLFLQPSELQPATIIVDEPELGLHPYAIAVFAEMVQQASVDKQVILSTQSVELLDQFDAHDVIVVDHDEHKGSMFRRLDADQLESWLGEYTLGELWKKNILGGRQLR